jgi:hypothetical protein
MSTPSLARVARGIVVASLMIGEGVRHGPGRSEFDRFFAEVMPAYPLRFTDSHPGGTMIPARAERFHHIVRKRGLHVEVREP